MQALSTRTHTSLVRKAVLGMMAVHRLQDHGATINGQTEAEHEKLKKEVEAFKEEAAQVSLFISLVLFALILEFITGGGEGGHPTRCTRLHLIVRTIVPADVDFYY